MDNLVAYATALVPLGGGLLLLLVCGAIIIRHPQVSNRVAVLLGAGGLLCVAPTISEFQGWGLSFRTREQKAEQRSEQTAKRNSAIQFLEYRVEALEKARGGAPASLIQSDNRNTVVLVYYRERKKEALEIERHLLKSGYSATVDYTDFNEIASRRKRGKGEVSVFYKPKAKTLVEKI
jgi:hypothetical protein